MHNLEVKITNIPLNIKKNVIELKYSTNMYLFSYNSVLINLYVHDKCCLVCLILGFCLKSPMRPRPTTSSPAPSTPLIKRVPAAMVCSVVSVGLGVGGLYVDSDVLVLVLVILICGDCVSLFSRTSSAP